jgi:2-hydroxy-3-oxopropionate reductase
MSSRLLAQGYTVVGYDVRREAVAHMVAKGAVEATSPKHVAERATIVMTSLPTTGAVREVALGGNGIIHGGNQNTIMVEMSTCGPKVIQEIEAAFREKHMRIVDAPVSGGIQGAEEGTLTVMTAGDEAALRMCRGMFEAIGKNIVYLGQKPGLGQAMKLINNLLSATALIASSEALVMAVKAGLDPDKALEVLNVSTGRSGATLDKFPRYILSRTFNFGSPVEVMYKDVRLAIEMAETLGVPVFVGSMVKQMWGYALNKRGKEDLTNIIKCVEEWAGVEVRGRAAAG